MNRASMIIAIGLIVSQPIHAEYDQSHSIEMHTGIISPSDSVENIRIDAGVIFGASAAYFFQNKNLGIYTGFDIDMFDANSVSGPDISAALLYGYSIGLAFRGDIPNSKFGYFTRAGTHFSKLQFLDDDDDVSETKYDAGFETSIGFTYELGSAWALHSGIRYKAFSRRFKGSASSNIASLDSIAFLLGAKLNF